MDGVIPCPECLMTVGYDPCGPYRVICQGCGSLLKKEEVEPNPKDEGETK